ncbi:tripartite tricarboxylate transporter TctB family protein [Reyranella sp.]|uniref:tripartite tricarboxylate transporter TctB family protein n=1 Tax=Reyranella sp. TaxID=1929291 RepID=UPI001203A86D|nr:tripartite tricarboxylate transporter TctB family protein [Reyranella sp.]TAJ82950.1 MAG: tripartite tricarboxylate transporter TctB family protein [Reyranella sp.]
MSRLSGTRIATLGLLAAALVGLWQSLRLDSWGFDGPGPGFFPTLVAGVCVVLAVIVFFSPGRAGVTEEGDTDDVPKDPSAGTGNTFAIYVASFAVLALGTAFAGFFVTIVAVTVLIMRFAERRSWVAAVGYGVACAAIGLVCFGWLLRVDLPEGPIERAFYTLVR